MSLKRGKLFWWTVVLVLVVVFAKVAFAEKPNIIVIFTDDHGYDDLSCTGLEPDVNTPHIERKTTNPRMYSRSNI
jgi:hypothetical protein